LFKVASQNDLRAWTVRDSVELYNVNGWGRDFFTINDAGNIEVTPGGPGSPKIDLKELVDDLRSRGLKLPLLIRFSDILKTRIQQLAGSFQQAIVENDYKGAYRGVYPIKVNQQRHIVEELVEYGRATNLGIEAGSKPELLVALALQFLPSGAHWWGDRPSPGRQVASEAHLVDGGSDVAAADYCGRAGTRRIGRHSAARNWGRRPRRARHTR